MPVPKKKTSSSRRDQRRSHHGVTPSFGIVCPECAVQVQPHRVCTECGYYRGRQVLPVKE